MSTDTKRTYQVTERVKIFFGKYLNHCKNYLELCHYRLTKETPLPIYVGLESHAKTRKRQLADTLFDLGISIFYDRVLSISADLGSTVCQQYRSENMACLLKMRRDLFSVAAVDNLDHNPSSTLSVSIRDNMFAKLKRLSYFYMTVQMVICVLTSVISICSPAKAGLSKPSGQQNGHYNNMLKGLSNKLAISEDSHLLVLLRILLLVTGDGLKMLQVTGSRCGLLYQKSVDPVRSS